MGLAVVLNGQLRQLHGLEDGASLAAVISTLALKPDRVAVEHKGDIVPRQDWDERLIRSGDKLEIVHFVGGGSSLVLPNEGPQG